MLTEAIFVAVASITLYILYWCITPWSRTLSRPHPLAFEFTYIDAAAARPKAPVDTPRYAFPSVFHPAQLELSIIVVLCNDAQRMTPYIESLVKYLFSRYQLNNQHLSEIILVDNRSRDDSASIALDFSQQYSSQFIRLLSLPYRMPMGDAIQHGALRTRGAFVLTCELETLPFIDQLVALKQNLAVNQGGGEAITATIIPRKRELNVSQLFISTVLGVLARLTCSSPLPLFPTATLYSRTAAQSLFTNSCLEADQTGCEMRHIAHVLGITLQQTTLSGEVKSRSRSLYDIANYIRVALCVKLRFLIAYPRLQSKEYFQSLLTSSSPLR